MKKGCESELRGRVEAFCVVKISIQMGMSRDRNDSITILTVWPQKKNLPTFWIVCS